MNKQTIKTYIGIIAGLIFSFNIGIYAWSGTNGLTAENGDKLSISKWNTLVNNMLSGSKLDIKQTDGNNIKIGNSFVPTNEKGLSIYYDNALDSSVLMSLQQGIEYKNILLNPNGGNIGIGTNNPAGTFEAHRSYADSQYVGYFSANNVNNYGLAVNIANTSIHRPILDLKSAGNNVFGVYGNGNVGIGTTNPTRNLSIQSSTTTGDTAISIYNNAVNYNLASLLELKTSTKTYHIGLGGGTRVDGIANKFYILDGVGGVRLVVDGSGNVGIGNTDPQEKLHVMGNVKSNGTILTSDQRFKKNIKTIDSALDKVSKLRGVTFDWRVGEFKDRNFSTGNQVGFIAQEVEKIIPQVVTTDKDGYKGVEYSNMTAVLVEAVKELKKENNEKNDKINELINRIEILENKK